MSENPADALVASILDDLTICLSAPTKEEACCRLHRAVHTLRMHASGETRITKAQQANLDAAIAAAQPMVVGGPFHNDQRVMVASLHVVTAEWAKPAKSPEASPDLNVLEAFILTRILDNWLCTAFLTETLRRKRASMTAQQLRSLSDLMDVIYPVAGATAETMPTTVTTVH